MRKIFTLLLLIIILVGCEQAQSTEVSNPNQNQLKTVDETSSVYKVVSVDWVFGNTAIIQNDESRKTIDLHDEGRKLRPIIRENMEVLETKITYQRGRKTFDKYTYEEY